MKATAKQVAAAAGVSLSAVSRAYAPEGSIDPEKKKRILAAAEAINYVNPARKTARLIAKDTVTLDALFCCNDIMALAAIDAAHYRGMNVGEDLAIVGFDDVPMASWNSYMLTTVSQPVEKMVRAAINVISDEAVGPMDDGSTQIFPGKLIKRRSG